MSTAPALLTEEVGGSHRAETERSTRSGDTAAGAAEERRPQGGEAGPALLPRAVGSAKRHRVEHMREEVEGVEREAKEKEEEGKGGEGRGGGGSTQPSQRGKRDRSGRGDEGGKLNGGGGRGGRSRGRGGRRRRGGGEAAQQPTSSAAEEAGGEAGDDGAGVGVQVALTAAVDDEEAEDAEGGVDDGYTGPAPRSALFECYYRLQGIVSEEEWEEWIAALQRRLPVTFRLSSINGMHRRVLQSLQSDEFGLSALQGVLEVDGRPLPSPPSPLRWYPDCMAWYLPCSKAALRTSAALHPFRRWLMAEFDQGNLNRQEAVSMIPTLLLQCQRHHITLDLCAAPGSKTAQILEDIHQHHRTATVDQAAESSMRGMVIANDADAQRAYMLVHQLKRLGSPAFLVTTHEGQHFPNLYLQPMPTSAPSLLLFDRILCDVPCSGDGTLRKNLGLWARWTPNFAYGLHPLQLSIAMRGVAMLKVGGLMVYSTCAFNPIENEAVVAQLLRASNQRTEGEGGGGGGYRLTLVDASDRLPGLRRSAGLRSWRLMDATGAEVEVDEEIRQGRHARYLPSMLPPSTAEAEQLHLERCMRILPHHQDTGGFFIALLHKQAAYPTSSTDTPVPDTDSPTTSEVGQKAPASDATVANQYPRGAVQSNPVDAGRTSPSAASVFPSSSSSSPFASSLASTSAAASASGRRRLLHPREPHSGYSEDPFIPMNPDVVQRIIDFYGLRGIDHSNFFARSSSHNKGYFVAHSIAHILACTHNRRLKLVHSGSRCYEKNHAKAGVGVCEYRICQEGIDVIWPYMTRQLLRPSFADFFQLLQKGSVLLHHFQHREDAFATGLLRSVQDGCVVLLMQGERMASLTGDKALALAAWKTPHSLALMIPQAERTSLLNLLTHRQPPPHSAHPPTTTSSTTSSAPNTTHQLPHPHSFEPPQPQPDREDTGVVE